MFKILDCFLAFRFILGCLSLDQNIAVLKEENINILSKFLNVFFQHSNKWNEKFETANGKQP